MFLLTAISTYGGLLRREGALLRSLDPLRASCSHNGAAGVPERFRDHAGGFFLGDQKAPGPQEVPNGREAPRGS